MQILFEDLAWLFSQTRSNPELVVEEAALVWKALRRKEGNSLEIGRPAGDVATILASALTSGSVESYGQQTTLRDDVDVFLKTHGIRAKLVLREAIRPEPKAGEFNSIIVHLQGNYLRMLTRLLIGWTLASPRRNSIRPILIAIRPTAGDPQTNDDWSKLSTELLESDSVDLFDSVGRTSAYHLLSEPPEDLLLRAAIHLRDAKVFAHAVDFHKRTIDRSGDSAENWHEYGRTLLAENRNEEAETALRKAVSLKRNHHYLNNLGLALMRLGRANDAIPFLHDCLKMEPTYVHALNNLGWAYEETGQLQ